MSGSGGRAGDATAHEHEFEPEYGLPEPLPAGERVLWQGSPQWRVMARRTFHVRKLTLYFGVILAARAATVLSTAVPRPTRCWRRCGCCLRRCSPSAWSR